MSKVIASAVVSLDGLIADTSDAVGPLFDWYNNGDVEVYGSDPGRPFKVSQASADYLNSVIFGTGVPFFGTYDGAQILLDNPKVIQGDRVTHLHYRVSDGNA